jgi:hypothetical protein
MAVVTIIMGGGGANGNIIAPLKVGELLTVLLGGEVSRDMVGHSTKKPCGEH